MIYKKWNIFCNISNKDVTSVTAALQCEQVDSEGGSQEGLRREKKTCCL